MRALTDAMQNDIARSKLRPTPRRQTTSPWKADKHSFRRKRDLCNARQLFFVAKQVQTAEFHPRLARLETYTIGQHEIDPSLSKLRLVIIGMPTKPACCHANID
jgi:hypothetical protein